MACSVCGRGLHHTLCNGRAPSCTGYGTIGVGTYPGTDTREPGGCSRSQDQCVPESLATESCVGAVVGELGASVGLGVETQLPGDPFPTTALAEVSE